MLHGKKEIFTLEKLEPEGFCCFCLKKNHRNKESTTTVAQALIFSVAAQTKTRIASELVTWQVCDGQAHVHVEHMRLIYSSSLHKKQMETESAVS